MVTALRTQNQVYIIDQVVQMLAGAMLLVGATTCYQDLNIAMYPSIGQKSLNVIHTKPDEKLGPFQRSEEHTSELQSRLHLVCRLLLEKKKRMQQSSLGS